MQEFLHHLRWWLIDIFGRLMFDLDIVRYAEIPGGPKILVSNHPSTVDPFLIVKLTPDHLHMLIDHRLFRMRTMGHDMVRFGHIPVIPGGGGQALVAAARLIREGKSMAIYPEGAISPLNGGFHRPRTGAARLALETGVPVIPVGVAFDRSLIRLIPARIDDESHIGIWCLEGPYAITVGRPMRFSGDPKNHDLVRNATHQMMQHIIQLAGESERRVAMHKAGFRPIVRIGSWLMDNAFG